METGMSLTTLDGVFKMKESLQKLGFVSSEKVKELPYTIADSREKNAWLSANKGYSENRVENVYCNAAIDRK